MKSTGLQTDWLKMNGSSEQQSKRNASVGNYSLAVILSRMVLICGCVWPEAGLLVGQEEILPDEETEASEMDFFGEDDDEFDIPLEELMSLSGTVISASKYEQSITEAPSAVTVIRHEDIQRFGYRTLSDVLKSVRGFYVSSDRNFGYLGVRGVNRGDYNSRVLVLVNGHRMNDNISDGARIGPAFMLDVDLIDRVEIVRGPGSVLYGNNAFFGVINLVTRSGSQIGNTLNTSHHGGEVGGSYGTYDTTRGRITYGSGQLFELAGSPVDLMLSGSLYDSDGDDRLFFPEFAAPVTNDGFAEDNDSDQFGSAFGSLKWRDFTLQGGWIGRTKQDPIAPLGRGFDDPRAETRDKRSFVHLGFEHDFDETIVSAQLYYDEFENDAFVPFDSRDADIWQNLSGRWWGTELSVRRQFGDRYQAVLGGEYRDDFQQDLVSVDRTGAGLSSLQDRRSYSFYFQNQFELLVDRLSLDAGIRYDHFSSFGDSVNPRVGLIYQATERTILKAIYGTAFRAPNVFELVLEPTLDAETIRTYELIWEQDYDEPEMRTTVSLFYNQIDDLVSRDLFALQNQQAETVGVEMGWLGFFLSGRLQARASYTYQQTEDEASGLELSDSPNHLGKLSASVPVYDDHLFANLEFQYMSARKTLMGADTGGFGIVNFNLFSRDLPIDGLSIAMGAFNILDRRYQDPAPSLGFLRQRSIAQDGRMFYVKMNYRF